MSEPLLEELFQELSLETEILSSEIRSYTSDALINKLTKQFIVGVKNNNTIETLHALKYIGDWYEGNIEAILKNKFVENPKVHSNFNTKIKSWIADLSKIKTTPAKKRKEPIVVKIDYINLSRIEDLRRIKIVNFDLSKLIRLCEEINHNWQQDNYYSVISLVRTVLHHVPPIFGFKNFEEIANNYSGGVSFKKAMKHLLDSSKNIADNHLHSQAQKVEVLPTQQQVNYQNDLDFLLAEIIKLGK